MSTDAPELRSLMAWHVISSFSSSTKGISVRIVPSSGHSAGTTDGRCSNRHCTTCIKRTRASDVRLPKCCSLERLVPTQRCKGMAWSNSWTEGTILDTISPSASCSKSRKGENVSCPQCRQRVHGVMTGRRPSPIKSPERDVLDVGHVLRTTLSSSNAVSCLDLFVSHAASIKNGINIEISISFVASPAVFFALITVTKHMHAR
mmetsp:Transcript_6478/g.11820  ORF Transcript_6478/g.11820 Transcript_6478/m.11820 type:complete len:204 (+) Transcript_6478:372-983(+)